MHGLHLTADLRDCPIGCAEMTDTDSLRRLCLASVSEVGLQPVGELFHRFSTSTLRSPPPAHSPSPRSSGPTGITGVVLLAESHLAVHTWPELNAVTIDVYVCNFDTDNSARARQLLAALTAAFQPGQVEQHALERGRQATEDQRA